MKQTSGRQASEDDVKGGWCRCCGEHTNNRLSDGTLQCLDCMNTDCNECPAVVCEWRPEENG